MKKVLAAAVIMIIACCAFGITAFADEYKLDENGVLWGKGKNEYGQLGREPQFVSKQWYKEYIPVEEFVPIIDNVKYYCSGIDVVYAIKEDETLWAWGWNDYAQCGVGHTDNVYTPVKILDNVRMVKDTQWGALAVDENGVLYAWGNNHAEYGKARAKGILGVGNTEELTLSPIKVLEDVKDFYASPTSFVTVAVKYNGDLWATGTGAANIYEDRCVFTKIEGVENVKNVSLSYFSIRVDTYDGDVYFLGEITDWGGTGSFPRRVVKEFKTPLKIMTDMDKAVGNSEVFALKSDGTLWYWGEDYDYTHARCVMENIKDIGTKSLHFLACDGTLYKYDYDSEKGVKIDAVMTEVECFTSGDTVKKTDGTEWKINPAIKEITNKEDEGIRVWINMYKFLQMDVKPYIKNDRTMVPMRAIFEELGAKVLWNDETKTAIGEKRGTRVQITIGENVLYKNGEAIALDCAAEITNNRTMVPVRAISEAFGARVSWNEEAECVYVTTNAEEGRLYYRYDDEGNLASTINTYGSYTNYELLRDESGKVLRAREAGPFKNMDTIYEYSYNDKGQMVKKSYCRVGAIYSKYGHKIDGEYTFEEALSYVYDEAGRLIGEEYPSGGRTDYVYNEDGKLSEKVSDNMVTKYFYGENGEVSFTETYTN